MSLCYQPIEIFLHVKTAILLDGLESKDQIAEKAAQAAREYIDSFGADAISFHLSKDDRAKYRKIK